MQTPFKTIGIIGKPSDPRIAETLSGLYEYLTQHQYAVYIAEDSVEFINKHSVASCSVDKLGLYCDLVIAVGGDGTFLAAARAIVEYDIPLIGINLGRLGFLVDISPNELPAKLHHILQIVDKLSDVYIIHPNSYS